MSYSTQKKKDVSVNYEVMKCVVGIEKDHYRLQTMMSKEVCIIRIL